MKNTILAVLITASAITNSVNAQLPAPKEPPHGPHQKAPRMHDGGLQQVTTVQGSVVKMAANDDFVYDGFYLLSGSDSILVKFPSHMGAQITAAVKTGSTVSVNGVLHYPPFGGKEMRMVSVTANGQTIADVMPATAPTPVVESTVTGNGKITSLQTGREGRVKGFILDGKTILKVPPHIAEQLGAMAQTGAAIAYTGTKKASKTGEVSTGNYSIIHCQTITVNGQQYLVR